MERDANYVAVGAFILLVIGMGVVFLVWYSDANDGREYACMRSTSPAASAASIGAALCATWVSTLGAYGV